MIKKTSSEKCTHPNLSVVIYFIISWSNNEALVKYFSLFFSMLEVLTEQRKLKSQITT